MKPYVGAAVIYHAPSGIDFAAVCTALEPSGEIALTFFPRHAAPMFAVARGWSHCGSNPDKPARNTWRWRTFYDEVGPNGRTFIAEIMSRSADWHAVLTTFANLADYRLAYRQQRAAALDRDWPDLPPEPPSEPDQVPDAILQPPAPPASSNGNGGTPKEKPREH